MDPVFRALEIVMQKRLAVVSVLSLLLSTNAFAQDAPVTDCDVYAASAGDPQRKSNGVPLDKINPDMAIPACEAAVQKYPDSSRLIYQLGRAYQKANDFDAAMVQYRKAADQGFAQALYNVGGMYMIGLSVPQDYAQAAAWFRKAADKGNANAQYNLGLM